MDNKPTLFIDSVFITKEGEENQSIFDSSKNKNKLKLIQHRLEDIKAMLFFKIKTFVIIKTKNENVEGIVKDITDEWIELTNDKKIKLNEVIQIVVKKI